MLDGVDQNGNERDSEEEGEYGEEEYDDQDISEETRKRLEEQGFAVAGDDDEDYDDEEDFDDEDQEGELFRRRG